MKGEDWLKTQFPFPLVPTSMDGVYTTPPLPDDLDLNTASDATLLRHGLLFPRPRPTDHPALLAAWKKPSEGGLRRIAPRLEPAAKTGDRKIRLNPIPTPGPHVTTPNYCGCSLQGPHWWGGVTGTVSLPYLSPPSQGLQGREPATLSAWVGLGGLYSSSAAASGSWEPLGPSDNQLLQAVITFYLDTGTNPPSTGFEPPTWLWLVPDPSDPYAAIQFGGGTLANAPALRPGDLVSLFCGYLRANDGSVWGAVSFLFHKRGLTLPGQPAGEPLATQVEAQVQSIEALFAGDKAGLPRAVDYPALMEFLVPGPPGLADQGGTIQWILENVALTSGEPGTVMPAFSASQGSITPLTFTQALGYDRSGAVTGGPENGWTILFSDSNGGASNGLATVALGLDTVSITYTGP